MIFPVFNDVPQPKRSVDVDQVRWWSSGRHNWPRPRVPGSISATFNFFMRSCHFYFFSDSTLRKIELTKKNNFNFSSAAFDKHHLMRFRTLNVTLLDSRVCVSEKIQSIFAFLRARLISNEKVQTGSEDARDPYAFLMYRTKNLNLECQSVSSVIKAYVLKYISNTT